MTARLGTVQRVVLLLLADGDARSSSRVEMDLLLDTGRAYGALMGLARRGYVDRDHTSGHGEMLWHLTRAGQELAEQVHGLAEPEDDDEPVTCVHGRFLDGPCRDCRAEGVRGDAARRAARIAHDAAIEAAR